MCSRMASADAALAGPAGGLSAAARPPLRLHSHQRAQSQGWGALTRSAGHLGTRAAAAGRRRSPLEPYTLHVPGDEEVGYKRLPVRILKIWHYLGQEDDCDWVMKADSDTYVNLPLGKVAHGRGEGTGIESHEALVFPCMAFFFFSFFL
ncbi:unnamed protein product, partial [Effrenium voratum]